MWDIKWLVFSGNDKLAWKIDWEFFSYIINEII